MERPSHSPEIIYNRGGNLATVTRLDQEKTREYMRRTDMRRWIMIVDSDEKPQGQTTQVGTDILAWRAIVPINKLLATRFRPQPLHTLYRDDAGPAKVWQIAVHERAIDEQIRSGGFIDRSDYEDQFLRKLNKAVKSGLLEALRLEKLGWHDQHVNYIANAFFCTFMVFNRSFESFLLNLVSYFFIFNPLTNGLDQSKIGTSQSLGTIARAHRLQRDWKLGFLPTIPFERYIAGKVFLTRNGHVMIVRKSG